MLDVGHAPRRTSPCHSRWRSARVPADRSAMAKFCASPTVSSSIERGTSMRPVQARAPHAPAPICREDRLRPVPADPGTSDRRIRSGQAAPPARPGSVDQNLRWRRCHFEACRVQQRSPADRRLALQAATGELRPPSVQPLLSDVGRCEPQLRTANCNRRLQTADRQTTAEQRRVSALRSLPHRATPLPDAPAGGRRYRRGNRSRRSRAARGRGPCARYSLRWRRHDPNAATSSASRPAAASAGIRCHRAA